MAGARGTWSHLFVIVSSQEGRQQGLLVLCSPFSFCKDQGLNPGNGTTHSGRVFSSVDLIEATPQLHSGVQLPGDSGFHQAEKRGSPLRHVTLGLPCFLLSGIMLL